MTGADGLPDAISKPAVNPLGPRADALGPLASAALVFWFGLLLVGIDLVHDPSVYDKTLVPRLHALLVVLGAGLAAVAVPKVASRLDTSVLREPICLWALGYAVVTAVSLGFAFNPTAGILDVVRTLATCAVLGLSCLLLPRLDDWKVHLLRLLVLSTCVTAGIGWYELASVHGVGFHERRLIEDVSGRMGNVNLLSGYLVFTAPACLAAGVLLRGVWRVAGWVVLGGTLALVVLLQSRAAFLGFGGAMVVGFVSAWVWRRPLGLGRRAWIAVLVTAAVVCGAVGGFLLLAGPDHPLVARVRSIVLAPAGDDAPRAGGRLLVWRLTADMIGEHPFTGVGAGNFPVRIQEYYDTPGIDLSVLQADNWLRPHNDFLQVCAEKGILGLVAFLAIFVVACGSLVSTIRYATDAWNARLAVFLAMALTAYLVCSGFDFPLERVSHQTTLAVLLAAATVLRRESLPRATGSRSCAIPGPIVPVVGFGLALGLAFGLVWTAIALEQERGVVAARDALDARDWATAVARAQQAATPWKTLDPRGAPVAFFEGLARMQQGDLDGATACLERARRHNPNRLFVLNNLGILYAAAERYDDAIECFALAASRYPHQPEGVTNLAGCYLDVGQPTAAIALLERVPAAQRTPTMREHLDRARGMLAPAATER
jgi:O-antigen ligase